MPRKVEVGLAHPQEYTRTFMVNRFHLVRNSGFIIGHFGLVDDSGKLLEKFSCMIPESTLKEQRENLVAYSAKMGAAKQKSPEWNPDAEESDLAHDMTLNMRSMVTRGIVDFIHLTNWDDAFAEICFWSYSKAKLADYMAAPSPKNEPKPPFPTWGLALLRCNLDLQREFLESLYPA